MGKELALVRVLPGFLPALLAFAFVQLFLIVRITPVPVCSSFNDFLLLLLIFFPMVDDDFLQIVVRLSNCRSEGFVYFTRCGKCVSCSFVYFRFPYRPLGLVPRDSNSPCRLRFLFFTHFMRVLNHVGFMEFQFYRRYTKYSTPFTNPSAVGYPAVLADVVLLFLN